MRRIPASVLLLLFSYTLITPLLFAEPESKIAACCRRDGKHRCAKMSQMAPENDGGVRMTATATCPLFPPGASAPVSGQVAVPAPVPFTFALVCHSAPPVEAPEVERRIAAAKAWLKRGPPTLLV